MQWDEKQDLEVILSAAHEHSKDIIHSTSCNVILTLMFVFLRPRSFFH